MYNCAANSSSRLGRRSELDGQPGSRRLPSASCSVSNSWQRRATDALELARSLAAAAAAHRRTVRAFAAAAQGRQSMYCAMLRQGHDRHRAQGGLSDNRMTASGGGATPYALTHTQTCISVYIYRDRTAHHRYTSWAYESPCNPCPRRAVTARVKTNAFHLSSV